MDNKVYEQEVIQDNPFPGEPQLISLTSQPNPAGTFTPTTTKEKTFPKKRTAVELLSTALNTRSRKILENFELEQSGGFQVGKFKLGVSGDLRITPNGLTARNKSEVTTFAIDGDTGDATFLGTIQAGSVITDSVLADYLQVGEAEGDITTIDGSKVTTNTLDADRIKASDIDVAVGIGNGNVKIDGANKRILINDGTNDRILIGYQASGF